MKQQAIPRRPLTTSLYNKALAACWKDFLLSLVKLLFMTALAVTTTLAPILIILMVVELIHLWMHWQNLEEIRNGSGVLVYYEEGSTE